MSAQPPPPVLGRDSPDASAAKPVPEPSVLELKAAAFTLPVIRLLGLDMDAVEAQLAPKVEQAPGFFRNTPVVIDVAALSASDADLGFPQLVGLLRGLGMIPVGVRGGSPAQHEAAIAMELAILSDAHRPRPRAAASGSQASAEPPKANIAALGSSADQGSAHSADVVPATGDLHEHAYGISTLVDRPVRSGQRVYFPGGDLVVLAAVSSGAELMADGNIHIYAPMRGRVIAGLQGNVKARIFCQDLQAELISVAGHYRVSENIPPEVKGKRVQIFLDHDILRIEPL